MVVSWRRPWSRSRGRPPPAGPPPVPCQPPAARTFFLDGPGAGDPATQNPREPLRLVLRSSEASTERLVAFRGLPGPFPSAVAFARCAADADPGLAGVVRLLAAPGQRGGT